MTRAGELFQGADPGAPTDLAERVARIRASPMGRAPVIGLLPERVHAGDIAALTAASGLQSLMEDMAEIDGWLLGVEEFASAPVRLAHPADPRRPGSLLILGDNGSGRTTMLRQALTTMLGRDDVAVHIVDPRRGLLDAARLVGAASFAATSAQAAGIAAALSELLLKRLPSDGTDPRALTSAQTWTGQWHVLIVDDYHLISTVSSSPLSSEPWLLGQGSLH